MKFEGVVLLFGYFASALVFTAFFMRSRARLCQVCVGGPMVNGS